MFTVDTPRWAGVPVRARSGKALARPRKEAVIAFKAPALPASCLATPDPIGCGSGSARKPGSSTWTFNGPGDPFVINPVTLVAEFGPGNLSAYGGVPPAC